MKTRKLTYKEKRSIAKMAVEASKKMDGEKLGVYYNYQLMDFVVIDDYYPDGRHLFTLKKIADTYSCFLHQIDVIEDSYPYISF